MDLTSLLKEKKEAILGGWFDLIVSGYPSDASRMLRKEDRFANPLGSTITREIEALFDALVVGTDAEQMRPSLDGLLRIKAVQDFAPSEAMAFIFSLKDAIRSQLVTELREDGLAEDLVCFESRIDSVALVGFDVYMKCREAIYQLKTDEFKRQTHTLLKRANRMGGTAGG